MNPNGDAAIAIIMACFQENGAAGKIADHHILQIQFFFCQLCPAGVRVGIRNDAAQRDPEQLLIDDVVFQRNIILKSKQQINLYIPADFAILSSRDAAALSAS